MSKTSAFFFLSLLIFTLATGVLFYFSYYQPGKLPLLIAAIQTGEVKTPSDINRLRQPNIIEKDMDRGQINSIDDDKLILNIRDLEITVQRSNDVLFSCLSNNLDGQEGTGVSVYDAYIDVSRHRFTKSVPTYFPYEEMITWDDIDKRVGDTTKAFYIAPDSAKGSLEKVIFLDCKK